MYHPRSDTICRSHPHASQQSAEKPLSDHSHPSAVYGLLHLCLFLSVSQFLNLLYWYSHSYLFLPAVGEHPHNSVYGVCRRIGVKSRKHKMACFCRSKRSAYRFIVTHFSKQYYIGRLTKASSQRYYIALAVAVYLTLADDALLILM